MRELEVGGALYETLLTSTFDGFLDPIPDIISPNEPDFFLLKDCILDLRRNEPNFSLSMTLLFLGESADGSGVGSGRCGGGDTGCFVACRGRSGARSVTGEEICSESTPMHCLTNF